MLTKSPGASMKQDEQRHAEAKLLAVRPACYYRLEDEQRQLIPPQNKQARKRSSRTIRVCNCVAVKESIFSYDARDTR